jgi:uncharacterized protein YyaL (SSP411 family)
MKKQEPIIDKWDGILDPIPFIEEPESDPSQNHRVFSLIRGYQAEAYKILKSSGYPATLAELLKTEQKERRIRDIMRMLTYFREVRVYISIDDAQGAALSMAFAIRSAMQARIRPVETFIDIGQKRSQAQKKNRGQRQVWKGLTGEQIAQRNARMIEHFKTVKSQNQQITLHGFATKYASKYRLGIRQITKIISLCT